MSLTLNIIRVVVQDSVIQHLVIQQKHQCKRFVCIYSAGPDNSLKIKKLSNKRVNTFERNHDKFYLVITKYNISSFLSLKNIFIFSLLHLLSTVYFSKGNFQTPCVCMFLCVCV